MTTTDHARRNLRRYPFYVGGVAFYAWMPVFFLYFSQHVSLADVLVLEAIYYATVVALEVPSGYFSDRFGRRPTLIIAAAALVASYLAFVLAGSFAGLALGQALLAVGLSFNSGTDTSFHLASLEAAGQSERYAEREASLGAMTFRLGAVAALLGGAGAVLDMRVAYGLSCVGALVALAAALGFRRIDEPRSDASTSLVDALSGCWRAANTRALRWLSGAAVLAIVINHIPYEFYQPYLEALPDAPWQQAQTPWIAGLHLAAVQLIASPIARASARLARRFGTVPVVLGSMLLQALNVAAMATWTSLWVAALLAGRSVPRALQDAPLRAAITPQLPAGMRATYLSLQSLAGRLGFALLLVTLSRTTDSVAAALAMSAVVAGAAVVALGLGATARRPQPR